MSTLTLKQKAQRGVITASFLPYLLAGDTDKILQHWRIAVGDLDVEEEDLSTNWPVQFGAYVEPFALDWHQRKTGHPLTGRGHVMTHPQRPWLTCTLDAFRAADNTVIDVKVLGGYRRLDEAIAFYTPQMVAQKSCSEATHAALLIVHGGAEPQEHPVEWTSDYELVLWLRVEEYYRNILNLVPPSPLPSIVAPVKPIKTYDMTGDNRWADAAGRWFDNAVAARDFEDAKDTLKKLTPEDAVRASGHGVTVSRAKNGHLSVKALTVKRGA